MHIEDLMKKLKGRGASASTLACNNVSLVDVRKAIERLAVLGGGFRIVKMGAGAESVLSVPMELNIDHEELIEEAENNEMVIESTFIRSHGWSRERFQMVISPLLREGMLWVDTHEGITSYMLPQFS